MSVCVTNPVATLFTTSTGTTESTSASTSLITSPAVLTTITTTSCTTSTISATAISSSCETDTITSTLTPGALHYTEMALATDHLTFSSRDDNHEHHTRGGHCPVHDHHSHRDVVHDIMLFKQLVVLEFVLELQFIVVAFAVTPDDVSVRLSFLLNIRRKCCRRHRNLYRSCNADHDGSRPHERQQSKK